MLNCDMAGVIAAMRGTPKNRLNPQPVVRARLVQRMETPEELEAWQQYTDSLADVNLWRDEL